MKESKDGRTVTELYRVVQDQEMRTLKIVFKGRGKKPEFVGLAILTHTVKVRGHGELEKEVRVDFPIEANDQWEAFEKYDGEVEKKVAEMKEEADEQLKKRKIVKGTQADLDRLGGRGNNVAVPKGLTF